MSELEFRAFAPKCRNEPEKNEMIVEGYAATFEPYELFECDGIKYLEQIDARAFDDCDMADVVFRVDHEGLVYARTSAGTVELSVDEHGLFNKTDLSRTADARNLYEHIEAGNYPKMSFAFTVREDSYDRDTHTRKILKIDKLYDISPVSFPANPGTELHVHGRDMRSAILEMEKKAVAEKREELKKELLAFILEERRKA